MTKSQFGMVTSIYTLGGLLGALLSGPCSTRYGRLFTLRATTLFFILGPIAESMAPGISVMALGRLLSGVASGASIVVGPIYVSEVAPPKSRGFFGASTQVMTNVGILITQTLGLFLSKDSLWRTILAVAGAIGVIQLIGLYFVSESPVWLADHGQPAQAIQTLQKIRGKNANIDDEVKRWEVAAAHGSNSPGAEEESLLAPPPGNLPPKQPPVSLMGAIRSKHYRPAVIAVVATMAAQQLTGINSIIMYSVSLLSSLLPTASAILAVLISILNLFVTILCSPLADKLGRKKCLLYSISGMGTSSILIALSMSFTLKALAAPAALLFAASFAVGLGPVPFILASELVGPEAVGATQSCALATNWVATFLVAQFFPIINEALGGMGRIYWGFAISAAVFGSFIYWWVPETKGKGSVDEVWGREESERRRVD